MIADLELEDGSNYQIENMAECNGICLKIIVPLYTHLGPYRKSMKHLEEVDMECNDMMDILTVIGRQ